MLASSDDDTKSMTFLMSQTTEPTPSNAKVNKLESLLKECQDDLRQEFQDSKHFIVLTAPGSSRMIFTACILVFVFSDCPLQETIIDNCDKLR